MYGTLGILDSLAATQSSVVQYGEDQAFNQITAYMQAVNTIVNTMLGEFVDRSEDRQRRYGGTDTMVMERVDEYGRPQSQKVAAGDTVGFPLDKYAIGRQWTKDSLEVMTGAQIAAQTQAAALADLDNIRKQILNALFLPTNYTFVDHMVDGVSLAVKRLVNADSASIPIGPNGEAFVGSSHTHYNFSAGVTLAAADLAALIEDVIEHHPTGTPVVQINRAQETAVRGLTGFTALLPVNIVPADTSIRAAGAIAANQNINDRLIGYFNSGGVYAEVWVQPASTVPAGYIFCYVRGGPTPLVMRTRGARGALRLVFENEAHPLRSQGFEREFGLGVWNRTNGAILYIDTGAASAYVAPTIS